MENLPLYISLVFVLTTMLTLFFVYKATHQKIMVLFVALGWLAVQGIIAATGFYTLTNTLPPRFLLALAPPFLTIAFLFFSTRGRAFLDGMDLKWLTLLHVVRIPVEIVLFWLFTYEMIPQIMTFEGRNFDILSGIAAFCLWLAFIRVRYHRTLMLVWNLAGLAMLINIVTISILSAQTAIQQFGLEQPNRAVVHFPFIWLPSFIVPAVFLSHAVAIRKLVLEKVSLVKSHSLVQGL